MINILIISSPSSCRGGEKCTFSAVTNDNTPALLSIAGLARTTRTATRYRSRSGDAPPAVATAWLIATCSRVAPISRIQLRTSAAIPPGAYPAAPERCRPRRCSVLEEGENGAGVSSGAALGDGERGSTKAGLPLSCGEAGWVADGISVRNAGWLLRGF